MLVMEKIGTFFSKDSADNFHSTWRQTMFGLVIPSGFGFITASLRAEFGDAMIRLPDVQMSTLGAADMSLIPFLDGGKYFQYLIS